MNALWFLKHNQQSATEVFDAFKHCKGSENENESKLGKKDTMHFTSNVWLKVNVLEASMDNLKALLRES